MRNFEVKVKFDRIFHSYTPWIFWKPRFGMIGAGWAWFSFQVVFWKYRKKE